jgi:hypothetical protein
LTLANPDVLSAPGAIDMLQFCQWLQHNSWIMWVDSSVPLSLMMEIMHYAGFFLLVGPTVVLDLRVMGLAAKRQPAAEMAAQLVPWMWTGLAFVLFSAFFMFAGDAPDFYMASVFRLKILVVLLAVIVGAIVQSKIPRWGELPAIPFGAKLAAFLSLVLWIGAILVSVEVPAISGVG